MTECASETFIRVNNLRLFPVWIDFEISVANVSFPSDLLYLDMLGVFKYQLIVIIIKYCILLFLSGIIVLNAFPSRVIQCELTLFL